MASEAPICRDSLDGICVGIPGVLYAADDTIISCPNARSLEGTRLRNAIRDMIGLPVMMESDVSMAAVGSGRESESATSYLWPSTLGSAW